MKYIASVLSCLLINTTTYGFIAPSSPITSTSPFTSSSSALVNPQAQQKMSSLVSASNAGTDYSSFESTDAPPLNRAPPRKIALIVEPTPFTHVSGYSNRFKEMLRYLKKADDKVEIMTTDGHSDPKDLPKSIFGYRIQHTLGFIFPLYKHITLSFDVPDLIGAKMIESFKPDIIHATSPGFLVYAALFYSRVMRIPIVASYHTHLPVYGRNYMSWFPRIEEFSWWLIRMVHNRCDLTLVTSPQMKEELLANGVKRVDVWRKGIDTVRFHPKFKSAEMREKMTDGNPDDFLLVYVGRVGAEKRLKDIKPVLEKMGKGTRLCMVGKGPNDQEIKDYFEGTDTVFTGQLSGDALSEAFASADAFVMPSDSETLGFVVLESMASGVPVVGARAGGIPSIIDDEKTSFLVEVNDTDGYVKVLNKLKADKEYREEMGKNARAEAERWGWEAATSVLRNIQYEKAMINFHSRAFDGFGRPGSKGLWRLLYLKLRRFSEKLKAIIRNRKTPGSASA
eukprot:CAMPEP_0178978168 /NCGR_PEP_ID=MMETSP0789-20121207/24976_1 /TAXON_ID=3005 /ORGANISM="Rhizosolenia setigera, Strain CCMP 1694" /LENGTH=508 /DNA_ID=CAMNT_0020667811 /DNA_START=226 /DNA_END=1752 /DNA_ORIENTATION=-